MTAKEYLQQIYMIDQHIGRLQRRRDALRGSMYSVGSPAGHMNVDKVQTSLSGDKMVKLIAQVDALERDIVEEVTQLRRKQDYISRQIEDMHDDRYRTILHERYVLRRKWDEIAEIMHMDVRWIYRLHGQALQAFGRQYKLTSERQ